MGIHSGWDCNVVTVIALLDQMIRMAAKYLQMESGGEWRRIQILG